MSDETSQTKTWARPTDELIEALETDLADGISEEEARERLMEYGENVLRHQPPRGAFWILVEQFKSLVIGLLVAAAVIAAFFGDMLEAGAIGVVVVVNAGIGFWMELSARRSMEALREIGMQSANIVRGGHVDEVKATHLVPGDVVILEAGDVVSADVRIAEANQLQADESVLTGESMPVSKSVDAVADDAVLAERSSMLFKGTAVTRGSGRGVVVGTGMETEIGRVTRLVMDVEEKDTPLEERIDELGRRLVWVCLALAFALGVLNWILGRELVVVLETSVALAIATIPEGLPIVATIALARGMWRMAKRNALVKNLAAVETLGGTDVICTDKTGTLTLNRMTAESIVTRERTREVGEFSLDDRPVRAALEIGALCNNAALEGADDDGAPVGVGDPLEVALLAVADRAGIDLEELAAECEEVREVAFDAETKMMATINRVDDGLVAHVKGAPEAVLAVSDRVMTEDGGESDATEASTETWMEKNRRLAGSGLRVIAVARKEVADADDDPYEGLTFVGLVGLADPPREDVRASIEACRRAGIRVVMVTGDQAVTARYIGARVGLVADENADVVEGAQLKEGGVDAERMLDTTLFARVDPEDKLDIVEAYQNAEHVVAMTGDGVNDAPALMKADIGIAMGQRGTQVAREAADIVLRDDQFSSIVAAVEQGRVIFQNIRNFVFYLLSCNVSELMVIAIAAAAFPNLPLPITPLQILYLNLVTDVFPALALGLGEGDDNTMEREPREPSEPILTGKHWAGIAGWGAMITTVVLAVYLLATRTFGYGEQESITIAFVSLAVGQLFHVFNMRGKNTSPVDNAVTRNKWIWGAVGLCVLLIVGPVYAPWVGEIMTLTPLDARGWLIAAIAGVLPLVLGTPVRGFPVNRQRDRG